MRAKSRCGLHEAAWRDVDALVLDRARAFFSRLLGFGLLRGNGRLEDFVAGLQVADGGLQRNGRRLHFSRRIYGFGGFGARFGCTSVGCRSRFPRLVNLAIALGQLFLQ